jgi:hypothetical protein
MADNGYVEGGFMYNGNIYKSHRITRKGYVAVKAFSYWHYFEQDGGTFVLFSRSIRFEKDIEP